MVSAASELISHIPGENDEDHGDRVDEILVDVQGNQEKSTRRHRAFEMVGVGLD